MTPEQLKEIEECHSGAMEGPYVDTLPPSQGFRYIGPQYLRGMVWIPYKSANPDYTSERFEATVNFLASSWQNVKTLTEEVRRLRTLLEEIDHSLGEGRTDDLLRKIGNTHNTTAWIARLALKVRAALRGDAL